MYLSALLHIPNQGVVVSQPACLPLTGGGTGRTLQKPAMATVVCEP
jgi:hypothetical protein